MVGTSVLAVLAAVLAIDGGPGEVPPDIAEWFEQESATVVLEMSRDMVVIDEKFAPPEFEQVEVGVPRRQHTWSQAFRNGEPADAPVQPLDQWGAPYTGDGRLAGTVVAWYDGGVASLAYADDAAVLAEAVAALPRDAVWVEEAMLGAHFAIVGEEVHTLFPGRYEATETVLPLEEFQQSLGHWLEMAGPLDRTPVAAGDASWPVLGLGALGLVLLGAGAALHIGRRRAAS